MANIKYDEGTVDYDEITVSFDGDRHSASTNPSTIAQADFHMPGGVLWIHHR
jgi:hypothetical protein